MVTVEIKKGDSLTEGEIELMNRQRVEEYGKRGTDLFNKKDFSSADFFFVKDDESVVAFGVLLPVRVSYIGKEYDILGIKGIMSIKKKKGYGKILIGAMIDYLKKSGKTGLGFCGRQNVPFYDKAGLKTKRLFGKRFALKNPKTGEIKFEAEDDVGDGIFYDGKDGFVSKVAGSKGVGYYWLPFVKDPHW